MLQGPFTDERLKEAEQEAATMGAVLVRADEGPAQRKEAEAQAQARWEESGKAGLDLKISYHNGFL